METRFTPGPWGWNKLDAGSRLSSPDTVIIFQKNSYGEITQANAHLIATAPDMYKTLGEARETLHNLVPLMQTDESGIGHDCTDLFQSIIDIDFILTKARGEQ